MDRFAERIISLSSEQRAFFLQRLHTEGRPLPVPALPRPANTPTPLSSTQMRLWFLEQLQPGTALYHIPLAVKIMRALDAHIVEKSIQEVIRRHAILRTSFEIVQGEVCQIITPELAFNLPLKDLAHLPASLREPQALRLIQAEIERPFHFSQGPLFRMLLVRLGEEEHILACILHHMLADGWSIDLLLQELARTYDTLLAGQPSPLEPLPVQYADYAYWQQQWLHLGLFDPHLAYWQAQLKDAPDTLNIPRKRTQSPPAMPGGALLSEVFPRSLCEDVTRLATHTGTTLFMVLLAAFAALLYHYTGQQDICVGTPIANRNRSAWTHLIGFFANTLPLRIRLTGNPTFSTLLTHVRDVALQAYEHQDVPFERIVEAVGPQRDIRYNPFFQVMFEARHMPEKNTEIDITGFQAIQVSTQTAKFELSVIVEQTDDGLRCSVEYSTESFDERTVQRMLSHFHIILQACVTHPERTLHALEIMTPQEYQQAVIRGTQTESGLLPNCCLPQLLAAQARTTPQAPAVICGSERVSYDELHRRARRIAESLRALQVGPETPVVLLADRDISLWIAVLAIWQAGGVYIPLDPHHPPQRWKHICTQCQAPVILTNDRLQPAIHQMVAELPGEAQPRVLVIHDLLLQDGAHPPLQVHCHPCNLAYILYTSGSTGTPKGVMIEHRGMINHLYAKILDLAITSEDVLAQTASQCFDISIWQFFAPLLVGATVHIFQDMVTQNPAQLFAQVGEQQVTLLETVPSLLRMMLTPQIPPAMLRSLRRVIVTGEALPCELCRQWLQQYPRIPLVNAFGATEVSDDATHYTVDETLVAALSELPIAPIGFPLAQMHISVLGPGLYPAPAGVVGEIYCGGIGVGRGYFGNPARTAAVFVPDPFARQAGERWYRSSDLGRRLPDGTIEILGRVDYQLKIRGQRIEPGEIEALLNSHADVRESLVVAREDRPAEQLLVAYVTLESAWQQSAESTLKARLQTILQDKLPQYMLPSAIVLLERFPLTSNGKVDRAALPRPDWQSLQPEETFLPAETALEHTLADLWCEVLGREQVGVLDNFFALGGTSLAIIRVHTLIAERCQLTIPIVDLFHYPSIRLLSAHIEHAQPAATQQQFERSRSIAARRRKTLLEKRSATREHD